MASPRPADVSPDLRVKRLKQPTNEPSPLIWTGRLRTSGTEVAGNTEEDPSFSSPFVAKSDRNQLPFPAKFIDRSLCRQEGDQDRELFLWHTPEFVRDNHRRYRQQGSKSLLAWRSTLECRQMILAYENMD